MRYALAPGFHIQHLRCYELTFSAQSVYHHHADFISAGDWMKRCPACGRSYADDTLSFCLQDGAQLTRVYDPEATVVAQPRKDNSHRVYQVIILLLLLTGVGIGLYFAFNKYSQPAEAPTVAQASPEPSQNSNAKPSPSPTRNDQPAIPKIDGKTYGVARKLLIQEGWLPNKHEPYHGQEPEVQSGNGPIFWKRGYWELETCSGTGLAHCLFQFIDPTGRLLEVVTEGEEDEAGTYHARVSRVYLKKK